MKKKFLSLMMAAAMVATTSVSAFAANDATVSRDGEEVDVTITGSVNDHNNNAPEGTISVTIPTALAFTVDNEGRFEGTSLNVVNNGTEKVEIYAYQFVDGTGTGDIEVAKTVNDSEKRSKVVLSLLGNAGEAGFESENTTKGIYNVSNPTASIDPNGVKIASVAELGKQNNKVKLQLKGHSGKNKDEAKAVREEFTLKLKVKKAAK